MDLRFAEKISGEDDWDEVKSALNKVPSSLRWSNFRLEGYDGLYHGSYKGLFFFVSGLVMRVLLLNILLQKIKKTTAKTCFNTQDLVLLKPGGIFLGGVGDAEEGLDPSRLTEIGAPGSPCWPLPCHQGGQLPHLAAAHFGGRRGCRSSPPLPLHRSVRSQKWSAGAINESRDTIPKAGGLDRCGCAFRCTFNLFRWLSRGGGGGWFIVKFVICMG